MRIWFNHWFSTAYHLIRLMRDGFDEPVQVIGSNSNDFAIYRRVCDEWYIEPAIKDDLEYVDFCLEFCRNHGVDIFVPRRCLTAVAEYRERFRQQGTSVFCGSNAKLIRVLDNKQETYTFFKEHGLSECIPEYRIAYSYMDFCSSYEELRDKGYRVCYKFTEDEGAVTFRVIDDSLESLSGIYGRPNSKVTFSAAKNILKDYDFAVPFLVMPYLEGPEISVDCLRTAQGNIVIPRYKTNQRYSIVRFDEGIMALSNRILSVLDLNAPLNLQFRMDKGRPFLLEINPRMSGGLQLSCMASGINIPGIALKQMTGMEQPWSYPDIYEQCVAHIESPICLP